MKSPHNLSRLPRVSRRDACTALAAGLTGWRTAAVAQALPLEIGVLPNISARVLMTQYQPLREYLARELDRPVQVATAPGWPAFHQSTLAQDFDLVITAAHLGRLAQVERGHVPLLVFMPNVKGLLAVPAERPLQRIGELSGRTLVLSNPQSLVTFRGMQWLSEQGLQRDRDFTTVGVRTDDSVGNVVLRGDAAAAMLSGGEFRAIPEAARAQLRILSTFAEVPGFVVLASPRLGAAQAQGLRSHLLHFANGSDEGRAFFERTGYTALREPTPGLMESLDPYMAATRRALAGAAG
jgi:phosphonate transport system substrate-binding protein